MILKVFSGLNYSMTLYFFQASNIRALSWLVFAIYFLLCLLVLPLLRLIPDTLQPHK